MACIRISLILAVLALVSPTIDGFTCVSQSQTFRRSSTLQASPDRRSFFGAVAGAVLSTAVFPSISVADETQIVDDLAMPTEEEQKVQAVSSHSRWLHFFATPIDSLKEAQDNIPFL